MWTILLVRYPDPLSLVLKTQLRVCGKGQLKMWQDRKRVNDKVSYFELCSFADKRLAYTVREMIVSAQSYPI